MWVDEMAAYAEPLPMLMGMPLGNGAVFLSLPGMPTPTSLTGLVNSGGVAGLSASDGAAAVSFAFTDAGGSSDTVSGSNTVKYSVSGTTDAAGDTVLDETITSSFSIGVASTRSDGSGWGLTESSDVNYTLHEVDAGSTITYTLSKVGSYTLNLNASGSYGVIVQSAAVNGGGPSGMTMTNSFSFIDSD
jgi:hypothetical protein